VVRRCWPLAAAGRWGQPRVIASSKRSASTPTWTRWSLPGIEGPFDLLIDYGTLDDLAPSDRRAMASTIIRLARAGSIFVLYAFYAARADLPRFSLTRPSRLVPVLEPGEEVELFGDAFEIERLPEPRPEHLTAAFVMTRRQYQVAGAGLTLNRDPQALKRPRQRQTSWGVVPGEKRVGEG
jgi:hypothetical protein